LDLPASVAPFILRSVTLAGIDSVQAPMALRRRAWEALAREGSDLGERIATVLPLEAAIAAAGELMDGRIVGRVVVDVNA
jgi:acrylyl-CoA reductase (NADPH)